MKKNRMMRLASVLLVLCLLTTSVISGTFAKYTSTATGSDTATVAKWSIKVSDKAFSESNTGTQIAVSPAATVVFDLFNTIKDSDTTSDETDVSSGLIAPGTSGAFNLYIKNESEVTAQYGIAFELTNEENVPLEFKVGNGEWKSTLDPVTMGEATKLAINADAAVIPVQWRWTFEGDHTALGIKAQTNTLDVTVKATITVDQVD